MLSPKQARRMEAKRKRRENRQMRRRIQSLVGDIKGKSWVVVDDGKLSRRAMAAQTVINGVAKQ